MTTIAPPIWLRITPFDYRRALERGTQSHANTTPYNERPVFIDWDDPEIHAALVRLYESGLTYEAIGEHFDRTAQAIGSRVQTMVRQEKLVRRKRRYFCNGGREYSIQEDDFLREHFAELGPTKCAAELKRPVDALGVHARYKLGLTYAINPRVDREAARQLMEQYMKDHGLSVVDKAGCEWCAKQLGCGYSTMIPIRSYWGYQPPRVGSRTRDYMLDKDRIFA